MEARAGGRLASDRACPLARAGLSALLITAPLPFGSILAGPAAFLELSAALLGAVAVLAWLSDPPPLTPRSRIALAASLALVGLAALQTLPLPAAIVRLAAPRTAALRADVAGVLPEAARAWFATSIAPMETLDALARLGVPVIAGIVVIACFRRPAHYRALALTLVLAAAFQAVYGGFEYLSGRQQIFGYVKTANLGEATGTFINRNHFASLLAMSLPLAIVLAAGRRSAREAAASGWRERVLAGIEGGFVVRALALLASFAIWAGLLMSQSRAGLIASLVGTGIAWRAMHPRPRAFGWAFASAVVCSTAWVALTDLRAPGERFLRLVDDLGTGAGRYPAWRATVEMLLDYPLLGAGFGTFESAFTLYRLPVSPGRWLYAHNDWLQAGAEGGLAALLLLGITALAVALPSRRPAAPTSGRPLATAALAALVAVALHSLVEFSLRMPANALLAGCLVGIRLGAPQADRIRGALAAPPAGDGCVSRRARALAALALIGLAAYASASVIAWRASLPPHERAGDRGWRWPLSASTLERAARDEIDAALAVAADRGLPVRERLGSYRLRLERADALLVESLGVSPSRPSALASLAAVRWELDPIPSPEQWDALLDTIALADRMAPTDPRVKLRLGEALMRMGRREDAARYLGRAAELAPRLATEIVAVMRGHLVPAREIRKVLPASSVSLVALAGAYHEDGGDEEYAALVEPRLLSPGSPPPRELFTTYADARLASANPGLLLRTLDEVGPLDDASLESERLRQRVRALLALGRTADALADASAVRRIDPESVGSALLVANVTAAGGDLEASLAALREAVRLAARISGEPRLMAGIYRRIGQAEEALGRPDAAYDAYRLALRLDAAEKISRERIAAMEREAGFAPQAERGPVRPAPPRPGAGE